MIIEICKFARAGNDGGKRLDWQCVSTFLESDSFYELSTLIDSSISVSLKGFKYLNPDGLLWILLLGDFLKKNNNELWLELPSDSGQLRQLRNSEFYKAGNNVYSMNYLLFDDVHDIKTNEAYKYKDVNILTLKKILTTISAYMTSSEFRNEIEFNVSGERAFEDIPILQMIANEVCKNIVQHSAEGDSGEGFIIINTLGPGRIRFTMGDTGMGFHASLSSKNISLKNDISAILEALLYHHTREGEGLFRVVQSVSRLKGFIRIRSGLAEGRLDLTNIIFNNDTEIENFIKRELKVNKLKTPFPGVQYMIDIRNR